MNIQIEIIKKRLSEKLPGLNAQLKMAPESRKAFFAEHAYTKFAPRLSAVVIVLFYEDDKIKIVFIRRGEYVGIHSGQIAFPGGKYEETDLNLKITALRELEEEIGINEEAIELLGQLTDLYIPPSNFLVRAYVAYAYKKPQYVVDMREVQEVIELDLRNFLNGDSIQNGDFMAQGQNNRIKAPCFDIDGVIIWGATAMLLSEFLEVIA